MKCTNLKPLNHYLKDGKIALKFNTQTITNNTLLIPCGKCIACRINKATEWCYRIQEELKKYDNKDCHFITLTYDNKSVPQDGSLEKDAISHFIKSLRNQTQQQNIKFYGIGEYGSTTDRPHYHILIFGLKLNDKKFNSYSKHRHILYTSATIQDAWHNKGKCILAEISYQTAHYVARYINKASQQYDKKLTAPYTRASKNHSIGYKKGLELYELFENNNVLLKTNNTVKTIPIPRYYYKLLEKQNTPLYELKKAQQYEYLKNTIDIEQIKNTTDKTRNDTQARINNTILKTSTLKRQL